MLNLFRDINWFIWGLNSISVTIPDWVTDALEVRRTFGDNIPEIPTFAKVRFTNTLSTFDETGPEVAIPLKPRNPRSILVLNQTA